MLKRKLLKGGQRRNTIDSDEDGDYVLDEATPSSTATTADGMDIEEPIMKRPAKSPKKLKQKNKDISTQFLDSFITEFTVDELAAKRTVETIYSSSGSFSYTFRCIEEALFAADSNRNLMLSFIKALAAVADEKLLDSILRDGGNSQKKKAATDVLPTDKCTSGNYQFLLIGTVRRLKDLLSLEEGSVGWERIMSYTKCFLGGLSREVRSLISSFFCEKDVTAETISTGLSRFKEIISTMKDSEDTEKRRPRATKGKFGLAECVDVMNQIMQLHAFMAKAHRAVATAVANRAESDGIAAMVEAIESELCIAGCMTPAGNQLKNGRTQVSPANAMEIDEQNYTSETGNDVGIDYKVECIKLLLSDGCFSCLNEQDMPSESDFLRQKLGNMCFSFEETRQRQREQQAEVARKCKLKRDAVTYVLTRVSESTSQNAPNNIRHPYYILGIPPSKCNEDSLRKWGRKLKTLLHPDTEHDPEWKSRAEQAFKEASVALEKCASLGGVMPNHSHMRLGALPPYAAFIGMIAQAETEGNQSNSGDQAVGNVIEAPTLNLMPSFAASCMDSKSGSINISVDPSIFTMNGFKKLGSNKQMVVYMHRPVHGDEPTALRIHQSAIYAIKRISIPESAHGKHINTKMDAVQPIVFGTVWKYFVGIQIVGDLGASLVSWRSVYVELSTKGRTVAQIGKLLATFEGAPFVNQSMLQGALHNCHEGQRSVAEAFLHDCTKEAQRWAEVQ
ncbi:hypothetical protein BgAZ_402440 [Babesia gibsoni]|uniref:J domain-containing protein n=1 Tax=Babesia gibsoni TaxID=33632 RepID=A0AAD8LHD1_BABGI|nr:hypothetical protein BgAZ_402440 [Babesia gibsoni]